MSKIQCKMCGGMLELPDDITIGECPYCNSTTTFPKLNSERKEHLYARAEHFRQANDFDRAIAAYEEIVREDSTDAEAYWGIVISRFGIEYVEDPVSHERIPTCHRVQYESILADADYKAALENAGGYERDVYEKEAQRIADIQKGILALSSQEKPFDVFICYKETTDGGSRTKDSALAQDIYYQLTNEGYKVFFARITLEDKLGQQYEPYIFAALNSAKVMLVIGSKKEHFNAVWVKNEWSRFLQLMKIDRSKLLIPCYRDMDAYEISDELSMLQSQDMSKIGFVQDLLRGIKKVVEAQDAKPTSIPSAQNSAIASLMKRVEIFLKTKEFDSAHEYCERILDQEPENSQAYIYRLMAENGISEEENLYGARNDLASQKTYRLALQFADSNQKKRLQESIIKQKNELIYISLLDQLTECQGKQLFEMDVAQLRKLETNFKAIKGYRDSQEQIKIIEKLLQDKYEEVVQRMSQSLATPVEYEALAKLFSKFVGYFDDAEHRRNQCRDSFSTLSYNAIREQMDQANNDRDCSKFIVLFLELIENSQCTSEIREYCQECIKILEDNKAKLCKEKLARDKARRSALLCVFIVVAIVLAALIPVVLHATRMAEAAARKAKAAAHVNLLITQFEEAVKRKDKLAAEFLLASIDELSPADARIGKLRDIVPADLEPKRAISLDLGGGVMLDLVLIRPGKFLMGSEKSSDEKPVHEVMISRPFYLGNYEVTQAQWKAVMGSNPSTFTGANLPVVVSWEGCQEFIKKLNSKGVGTFRLPTEAEWEYACRAGTTGDYAGNLDKMAWYGKNSGGTTQPVGTKRPNQWGLDDMHGNVCEWCLDWYGDYSQDKQIDPTGAAGGSERVRRGGGWGDDAGDCRSASRYRNWPAFRSRNVGFRLVRAVQ